MEEKIQKEINSYFRLAKEKEHFFDFSNILNTLEKKGIELNNSQQLNIINMLRDMCSKGSIKKHIIKIDKIEKIYYKYDNGSPNE